MIRLPQITIISIRESFDRANPWMARITGFSFARGQRKVLLLWLSLLLVWAVLAAFWIAGLVLKNRDLVQTAGDITWGVCVGLAFIAPSLGASARRRLDFDRMLPESLATRVTDREYIAAIHASIVALTFCAFLISLTVAAMLWLVINFPDASLANPLVTDSLLRLYLRLIEFNDIMLAGFPAYQFITALLALLIAATYASGVYLHATMLASYCQRDRMASFNGGIVTAMLILLMMVLLFFRYFALPNFIEDLLRSDWTIVQGLFAIFIADGIMLAARIAWARAIWKRILATAINETRSRVV